MLASIGDSLSLAVGIAISPIPIIAAILMLLSPRARQTSPAFLVGWVVGVAIVSTVFVLLGGVIEQGDSDSGPIMGAIKLVLGVALVVLAVRKFLGRPKAGETAELPKWMDAITTLPPLKALGMGIVLAGLNPKNLALAASAGIGISAAGLNGGQEAVVIAVFVIVASLSVGVPIIAYLLAPERLGGPLESLRGWLEHNNATVMSVVMLVLGFNVIGKALASF